MSAPAELGSMREGDDDIELAPLSAPKTIVPVAEAPAAKVLSAAAASLPQLTIAYHNASVGVKVSASTSTVQTVLSPVADLGRFITGKSESRTLWRVHNASGVIRPGTLTMILAPPGHGKSTMLRLMSDRLRPDENDTSSGVRFNGLTVNEAVDAGCNVRRLCAVVDQIDQHLPLLTVKETLEFASQCTSRVQDPARVESVIKLLGLEECQNTIIGDALVRGVSGGQKRRVTIGEMLVGDARAIFLDEYTNGLDTATAEDITRGLRKWAREMNASVVVTVQQPTPGLFAQFDDIIILNNADVIYHGPRDDVVPYFSSMGFNCPDDVDVCDFVIDCVSQPRVALERLQHSDRSAAKAAKAAGIVRDPTAALASTKGQLVRSTTPCVTAQQMLTHYHASPYYAEIARDLKPFFPNATFPSGVASTAVSDLKVVPLLPNDEAKATYSTGFVQPLGTLLKMVTSRQGKIVIRNEGMVMPRIFQSILMGLIYGSVYYQIPADQFFLRVAVCLMIVGQVAFANMVELPFAVQNAHVVTRQSAAGFYPTWAYVFAASVIAVPLFVVECALLSIIVYFMAGNVEQAAEFFTFFAIAIVQCFNMSVWFRFIASAVSSESSAQAIAGPSTGVFMLLGGFFVTFDSMPVWMRWLMWISPFNWSVRALVNNEFLSSRYDELTSSGVRIGTLYLEQLDMKVGVEWIGYSVLYLMGLSFILMGLHSLVMQKPFFESSIGTRRFDEEEVLESEEDKAAEDALKAHDAGVEDEIAAELEGSASAVGAAAHEASRLSNVSSLASGASFGADSKALKTLREALPFTPMWLSFSDLHYTVKVPGPDGKGTVDRPLLRGVNGYAEPGKLTALMGASGAGKTTLLDVLAGRKNTGVVEGSIKFNGRTPSTSDVAYHTGYVEQFDSLFAFDTVYETLLFAARLRLPASVSDEVKQTIVNEVLDILELTSIRDFIIGNGAVLGLSPSQLKRVNIGCELVANPAILFLDEPTTGLDSRAAQTVVRVVRRIARSGRSVICTIHQPSAELFYLFDRLVLLASGGHQVFFGSLGVRCKHFIPYIESIEGVSKCPPRYNPASWMLEEMGVGQTNAEGAAPAEAGQDSASVSPAAPGRTDNPKVILERFKKTWLASRQNRVATDLLRRLDSIGEGEKPAAAPAAHDVHDVHADGEIDAGVLSAAPAPVVALDAAGLAAHASNLSRQPVTRQRSGSASSIGQGSVLAALPSAHAVAGKKEAPPVAFAFWQVQKRMVLGYWRNPPVLLVRSIVVILLSLLFGLIYFDLNPVVQAKAVSLISVASVSVLFLAIIHGATSLPNMVETRPVLYRELSSDMYPAWMWAISNFFNELFWGIFTAFLGQIPMYFLVGLDSDADIFWKYWFATWLAFACYTSMSCLLAVVSPNLALAGILQGMYFGVFNIFSGVTVVRPRVPRGWMWFFRMLPGSHLTEALVMDQFGQCSPLPECGPLVEIVSGTDTTSEYLAVFVKEYLGFEYGGYGNAIGWTILFIAVVQILCIWAITKLNFSKR